MRLEIRDFANRLHWAVRVDGFLHDAQVAGPSVYDDFSGTFTLPLRRVAYEAAVPRMKLGPLVPAWRIPRVSTLLSFAPVEVGEVVEHGEAPQGADRLCSIDVTAGPEIAVRTQTRTWVLRCPGAIALRLGDTSEPEPSDGVLDLGGMVVPREVIDTLSALAAAGVATGELPPRPKAYGGMVRVVFPIQLGALWRLFWWLIAAVLPVATVVAVLGGHYGTAIISGTLTWSLLRALTREAAEVEQLPVAEGPGEESAGARPVSRCPRCQWECFNGNVTQCARCGAGLVRVE